MHAEGALIELCTAPDKKSQSWLASVAGRWACGWAHGLAGWLAGWLIDTGQLTRQAGIREPARRYWCANQ